MALNIIVIASNITHSRSLTVSAQVESQLIFPILGQRILYLYRICCVHINFSIVILFHFVPTILNESNYMAETKQIAYVNVMF